MSKKTCPVCSELSDQCLLCNSYVVDGERVYYNEIKNYGAIEEYELQFIEHIHKHHVVAFFHKGKLYIPSRQGRSVPLAIGLQWNVWQLKQAEINQLKNELALCREENKRLIKSLNIEKKQIGEILVLIGQWKETAFDKTTHWTEGYEEGCYHCAYQLEEALQSGDQNTKNKAQSIENTGHEGGDQKAQQSETAPVPKWSTIKVVCQRCGHYLNGCHCNHFGDQCPHLNTSKFGDDGLAECFNCNKIINKDREVVGGADDINLTR